MGAWVLVSAGGDASFVRQRSGVDVFWEGEKVACWGGGGRILGVGELEGWGE